MIRRFECPYCEEGRVECSQYGGLDPNTWISKDPCSECDGEGNEFVDDDDLIEGEITTFYDNADLYREGGSSSRQWRASAGSLVEYAYTEADAVRRLVEAFAAAKDERDADDERQDDEAERRSEQEQGR